MSQITGMQIVVNDGEPIEGTLTVETQIEEIYSEGATKADPHWSAVDAAGHFHAWARGGTYPTLTARSRHVPCDGSCGGVCGGEGWQVTEMFCRICDEEIQPGRLPDSGVRHITTGRSWSVVAHGLIGQAATGTIVVRPPGTVEKVTVRVLDADRGFTWFGVAVVGEVNASFSRSGMSGATTKLHGIGELGEFSRPVAVQP